MPIYSGSETQGQDARIVSTKTVAESPAYRGTALHVVEDFQLADFGNRIPNMQYEVFSQGSTQSFRKVITLDSNIFQTTATSGAHFGNAVIFGGSFTSGTLDTYRVLGDGTQVDFQSITPQAPFGSPGDGLSVTDGTFSYNNGRHAYCVFSSSPQYAAFFKNGTAISGIDGVVGADGSTPVVGSNQNFVISDNYLYLVYDVTTGTRQGTYLSAYSKDGSATSAWDYFLDDLGFSSAANTVIRFDNVTKTLYAVNYDTAANTMDVYSFDAIGGAQLLTWIGLTNTGVPGGDIRDGIFWYGDLDQAASPGYTRTYLIELNLDQTFTELQSHDGQSVIDGGADSDTGGASIHWLSQTLAVNGLQIWTYSQQDASATTLQSVVEDLCSRAGMAASDYDASGLAGTNIDGYAIKGVQSLRQQLEPLMQVYEFEPYEDDYKLKFAFRGGAPILTVTEADMRPHEYGSDGGEFIQIQHTEASKLPRRVNISYMNINADFEPDMQFFERSASESVHVSDLSFQMAFTPTFAIQLADKLLHEAWVSRTSFSFSLPKKYAYLAPTNVIVLDTDDFTVEVRLLEVGTGIDGRIQCKAVQSKILNIAPKGFECDALESELILTYGQSLITVCEMAEHDGTIITASYGSDLQNWSSSTSTNWGHISDSTQISQCTALTHFRSRWTENSTPVLRQDSPTVTPKPNFNIGMVSRVYASDGYYTGMLFQMRIHPHAYTDVKITFNSVSKLMNGVQFHSRQFPPTGSAGWSDVTSPVYPIDEVSSDVSHLFEFRGSIPGTVSLYVDFVKVASHYFSRRWQPDYTDLSGIGLAWHNGQNVTTTPLIDSRNNYDIQLIFASIGNSSEIIDREAFFRNFRNYIPYSPYTSNATTEDPVVGEQVTPLLNSHVFFEVIDTSLLLASTTGLPVYVAGTSSNFNGYMMQKSLDDGATWSDIGSFQDTEAIIGVAQAALGSSHNHFTGRFDDADSLTVKFLTIDPALSSVTDLQAMNGSNAFAIGAVGRWEIISAATITQVDTQTFTLSRLLRGMKGTEAHIGSMQIYDSVVLLSSDSVGILPFQTDDIGTTIKLRAVYDAGFPDPDDDVEITISGEPYKEYAPAQIMGYWKSSGDIELSWNRRTRKNGAWRDSVDVPLDTLSNPEKYTIKIYDNTTSPETLVRTVSNNSTNSYTYTSANIASDIGSPVSGQIRIEVYQVDTIVGAARYGEAVI